MQCLIKLLNYLAFWRHCPPRHRHHHHPFNIFINLELVETHNRHRRNIMNISTTMNDAQKQLAHIVVKDKAGQIDSTTTAAWVSADPTIVSVDVDPSDTLQRSAMLTATGAPGQTTITATCGAATLVIAVAVTASDSVEIDATFDDPTDK